MATAQEINTVRKLLGIDITDEEAEKLLSDDSWYGSPIKWKLKDDNCVISGYHNNSKVTISNKRDKPIEGGNQFIQGSDYTYIEGSNHVLGVEISNIIGKRSNIIGKRSNIIGERTDIIGERTDIIGVYLQAGMRNLTEGLTSAVKVYIPSENNGDNLIIYKELTAEDKKNPNPTTPSDIFKNSNETKKEFENIIKNGVSVNGAGSERGETGLDESSDNYYNNVTESDDPFADDKLYYNEILKKYNSDYVYSAKSFNSIVGMPVQFMGNVDMRVGQSTFGHRFTEDILYDAPICTIIPGVPEYQAGDGSTLSNKSYKEYLTDLQKAMFAGKAIVDLVDGNQEDANGVSASSRLSSIISNLIVGKYSRFFGFRSDYSKYIQYVNTLCHLFTTYLGISDKTVPGTGIQYKNYTDDIESIESDQGLGLSTLLGTNRGLHVYYQPDSSLGQTFSNSTQESALANKLNEVSSSSKEAAFFMGAVGANGRNGAVVGGETETGLLYGLATNTWGSSGMAIPMLSRIFSRTGEGVATIIGGNNLQLPEIYSGSSNGGSEFTLNIKLANPYGTPEGAFLFQLRHLARLLAVSLPRQYGPNGYTSPFIVRAFSKGQFNVQLGIVTSLSISRAGDGGMNQTIHDIPMELNVSMTIKDLYREICISNEYTTDNKGLSLLFNNVGLLDFVASYAGYNLNAPVDETKWDYIIENKSNIIADLLGPDWKDIRKWKFPKFKRDLYDAYINAASEMSAFLSR